MIIETVRLSELKVRRFSTLADVQRRLKRRFSEIYGCAYEGDDHNWRLKPHKTKEFTKQLLIGMIIVRVYRLCA